LAEIPATNLAGEDAIGMDIDVKPELPNLDTNFVDDDDLQTVLARSRRRKVRKMKTSPEEIATKGLLRRCA
jgi:U4/U6.U5 tri-snRNP-associated protein 1